MGNTAKDYCIFKLIAIILSAIWLYESHTAVEDILVKTLVVLCFTTLDYFLSMKDQEEKRRQGAWMILIRCVAIAVIFLVGMYDYSLVTVIIGMQLMDSVVGSPKNNQWIGISCAVIAEFLLAIAGTRGVLQVGTECCILLTFGYTLFLEKHIHQYKEERLSQNKRINELEKRLMHNKQLTKNIRYAAGLEERNRLAVRLHDKIGHNISGSIMILEAAMLQYGKNPAKAMESVRMATDNLKQGVDEIRAALREERPVLMERGSNDLQLLLAEMETKYNFHTFFRTEGPLENLSAELWKCIYDNVKELITNTVKHSKGSMFTIELQVMSHMVKVTCYDNGACTSFIKGMGLQAIEERSIACGGKCFFEASQDGFRSTIIFTNYQ